MQVVTQKSIYATPASLGLQYKDVTFPSRDDHLQIQGWFIPGISPNGHLTAQRTIIIVHGNGGNRADQSVGLLNLSSDLAHRGFAVLAFDMRGAGQSPPAPRSFGVYEQRDIPAQGHLPPMFTPGGLLAAQVIYGVDYYSAAPVDVIAQIDPRPIFLIHRADDNKNHTDTPPSNMSILAAAARSAPNAHVQTWLVPGATHARAYKVMGIVYVDRIVAFYMAALGPHTSGF